ncbi:15-cis-phytoene desaturase, chloroplastic/chromoplastic-like [Chenopodium quinoa]|nr:15-cis-phytoene desaturase, chloroplastic/chromoplastic-like [Chenopodium quinoa]
MIISSSLTTTTTTITISHPQLLLPRRHRHRNFSLLPKSTLANTNDSPPAPATTVNNPKSAIIIGGGLAGLSAATHLHSSGVPFLLLEASDGVGGRVRIDLVDGFLLDRGFQIFITAYPEAQKLLDYSTLDLQKFYSGARVYYNGGFHTVADPVRHYWDSIGTLGNPIGTILDKLLIGLTRIKVLTKSFEEIVVANEVPVIELLRNSGFSDSIIDRFFRPFFGGIFFDRDLETSSRLFDFIFRCLALGDNTLPAKGIGEIPNQLVSKLPQDCIRLNLRVESIDIDEEKRVNLRLDNGESLRSEIGVILAVEKPEVEKILAGNLLEGVNKSGNKKPGQSTVCLYFTSDMDKIPTSDPVLYLNGSGRGIVNNMFFATNVARSYGPPNKALVSTTLIGLYDDVSDDELIGRVVRELLGWFGESIVGSWKHLRTYRVKFAQPNQSLPTDLMKSPRIGPGYGLYLCGDYQTSATFDGALVSGRRAVEALLEDRAISRLL